MAYLMQYLTKSNNKLSKWWDSTNCDSLDALFSIRYWGL